MKRIEGLAEVAKASKKIKQRNTATWLNVYYEVKANKVMTEAEYNDRGDKNGCYFLTSLIRECSEKEIENTVNRMLRM